VLLDNITGSCAMLNIQLLYLLLPDLTPCITILIAWKEVASIKVKKLEIL
jgi:hypothetical protein